MTRAYPNLRPHGDHATLQPHLDARTSRSGVAGGEDGRRGMGRTNGMKSDLNSMLATGPRDGTVAMAPLSRAPGATLWAFLVGIMVGIALAVLR